MANQGGPGQPGNPFGAPPGRPRTPEEEEAARVAQAGYAPPPAPVAYGAPPAPPGGHGAPPPYPAQGQYGQGPPQGQHPPQGQYGQAPPQGQYPQQGAPPGYAPPQGYASPGGQGYGYPPPQQPLAASHDPLGLGAPQNPWFPGALISFFFPGLGLLVVPGQEAKILGIKVFAAYIVASIVLIFLVIGVAFAGVPLGFLYSVFHIGARVGGALHTHDVIVKAYPNLGAPIAFKK